MKIDCASGAGIICYFDNRKRILENFNKEIIYLVLENFDGSYDFTKGAIELEEENIALQCALRETYEESNIDSFYFKNIIKEPLSLNKRLVMYLGELKIEAIINKIVRLNVNPLINSPEHNDFHFLNFKSAIGKLPSYLKPYLVESNFILNK